MRFKPGFTLIELVISVGILTLISTSTVFVLKRSREKDELQIAARMLAADLRDVQARALHARNTLTCNTAGFGRRVCEPENQSPVVCADACAPSPPPRFGIAFTTFQDTYSLFADVNTEDWRLTSDLEVVAKRGLNPLGGSKVVISRLETNLGVVPSAQLGAARQSGGIRLEACGDPGLPACVPTEPTNLIITLRHISSNDTTIVEVNALTGRVSM